MRSTRGARSDQRLQLLGRLSLSPRTRVTLIQVDGHKLLLTESGQAIEMTPLPPTAPILTREDESPWSI